ncbi:MAG: insulinase family protein [Gemmatimonadaceae bacterium]|nr:insulinase family protein [Gemmatimonadaceae bacterium]
MTPPPPPEAESLPAAVGDLFPEGSVRREILPNGLRVLARRTPGTGVVAIVTYVGAGYFDEPDQVAGVAHVLEHMYFKGTPRRGVGEIARETRSSGGILNAATIYDHTHYYVVLPATAFEAGLDIQADAFANSLVDAGELHRELEVIIEEAKRKADNPQAVATETMFALLHDRHRIRRWRIGREDGLRALTRDDVVAFYRNFYRPNNTVVAVVGDVEPAAAIVAVAARYGHVGQGPVVRTPGPAEPEPADGPIRYRELSGDVQQSELLLGWRTPGLDHPDTPVIDLIATILSGGRASRLYRGLRDRRLASFVGASNYTPTELGVFTVHATARPERSASALRAAWDQVRRIREGEVAAAEVERARRFVMAQWMRRLETSDGQANHLAEWELAGGWRRGSDYLGGLLTAGPEDVVVAANRWLGERRAGVLVYRPAGTPAFASGAADVERLLGGDRPEPIEPVAAPAGKAASRAARRAMRMERREGGACVYRMESGVPIVVQRVNGPVAYMGWFVNGGVLAEREGEEGITSLMAHAAIRGTQDLGAKQLAEAIEFSGGTLAAAAGHDGFQWTVSVPSVSLVAAADILADVVQRPAFRPDAVEGERAVALAGIAAMRDDMYRWPLQLAGRSAWSGHPYGRSVLGTEQSLGRLGAAELEAWHAQCALSASGVLACVADAAPDDVAALLAERFAGLTDRPAARVARPQWPTGVTQHAESRDKAQTALAMLFPGPARRDDDRFAAAILSGIVSGLGGRFFEELRSRQSLAYVVHFAPIVRKLSGAFLGYVGTSPEKEEAARSGLLREIGRLRDGLVTPEELARARTYALGANAIRREAAAAVLGDIADAWLYGNSLDDIASFDANIRAVTEEDVRRVARECLDPGRRVEGIVRGSGKVG